MLLYLAAIQSLVLWVISLLLSLTRATNIFEFSSFISVIYAGVSITVVQFLLSLPFTPEEKEIQERHRIKRVQEVKGMILNVNDHITAKLKQQREKL